MVRRVACVAYLAKDVSVASHFPSDSLVCSPLKVSDSLLVSGTTTERGMVYKYLYKVQPESKKLLSGSGFSISLTVERCKPSRVLLRNGFRLSRCQELLKDGLLDLIDRLDGTG